MRGQRRISKLVTEFTGIPSKYSDEFLLGIGDGFPFIHWTDGESAAVNKCWAYRLKEDYGFTLTNKNVFIMSVLHELGHAATIGNYSVEYWNQEWAKKEQIGEEMNNENFFEKNQEYFLMPTEKAATDWAVNQYVNNYKVIKNMEYRLNCAVRHYEKCTGRKVFERF